MLRRCEGADGKESYWGGDAGIMNALWMVEPQGDAPPWAFARAKAHSSLGQLFFDSELMRQLIQSGVAEQIKADQFHGSFAGTSPAGA